MTDTQVSSKPIAQVDDPKTSATEAESQTKSPDGRSKTVFWQRKDGLFGRNPAPRD
jgi:hypothetical protein